MSSQREITLSGLEQQLAKAVAFERYKYDRMLGLPENRHGAGGDLPAKVESFGAELAYCRMVNCYPDIQSGNFNPVDVTLPNGKTVDVKNTNRSWGRLLVDPDKIAKRNGKLPDYYALMVGQFPTFRLAGYCRASDIIRPENMAYNIPHPAYALEQKFLVSLEALNGK